MVLNTVALGSGNDEEIESERDEERLELLRERQVTEDGTELENRRCIPSTSR